MSLSGLSVILAILAGAESVPAERPVPFSMWAVAATQEDRKEKYFDEALEPMSAAVADLPFDTYHKVRTVRQDLGIGVETRIPLNEIYTLFIKPISRSEDGRIRLGVRVEMPPKKKGGDPVKALATEVLLRPGEMAKFGGFRLEEGRLVIVVAVGR